MARTELERLARIRMQVTGETLERAMAVLEGHSTATTSQSEPDAKPDAVGNSYLDNGTAEIGKVEDGGVEEGQADESGSALATNDSDADTGNASKPDARRTPQKRGHLRGL
ncbi:hypothetical protein QT196_01360 [Streptomyces sp. P9-2B-2]|uniref:hypothetical protein n=1 Tax=Streptomyces sp. P9-2B-2 TaxID=3057114 RepID=UPI0025B54AEF|nr:hypothetical protein [Streptomyces sp. P9-2B-2]WJY36033.1 hypothetical protein QT196_01360 [Streptomyces sp. P9-2B-2]